MLPEFKFTSEFKVKKINFLSIIILSIFFSVHIFKVRKLYLKYKFRYAISYGREFLRKLSRNLVT